MDLGESNEAREANLSPVKNELGEIWSGVKDVMGKSLVSGDLKDWNHCDRPFCDCHKIRNKFRGAKGLFQDDYEGKIW